MVFNSYGMGDKTGDPTPRRLRRAREEGDAGVSAFAAQGVAFVVAAVLAPAAVRALADQSATALRAAIERAAYLHSPWILFDGTELASAVVALSLPVLAAAGTASGVAHLVQTRGVIATRRLSPDPARLDPVAGLRRLASGMRLFGAARSLAAVVVVGWIAWRSLADHAIDFAHVARAGGAAWIPALVGSVAGGLAWRVALAGLGLGVVDALVVRAAWMRRMRPSRDEARRDIRENEGDPQLKAVRERLRRHDAAPQQAAIEDVEAASVVVLDSARVACALRYEPEPDEGAAADEAPVVVAIGEGETARQILIVAESSGVAVASDPTLARALFELRVGDVVPEALYDAVAELLAVTAPRPRSP
jgi:flagellar biosynthesis protein FlhB